MFFDRTLAQTNKQTNKQTPNVSREKRPEVQVLRKLKTFGDLFANEASCSTDWPVRESDYFC
jgi:hypothetical protein